MWKKIEGYEKYSVSDSGDVRNDKTGKILKPNKNKVGYYKVNLWVNGREHQIDVHRLVAQAFIPNPNNYPQVNHKEASRVLKINSTNISRCLHGVYNTAGGYKWSYVSPLNNNQHAA